MMIHTITSAVDYDQWLKRLDTQLNLPTNQNSTKVLKVVKPTNKKCNNKTLGTSVINSSMSSPSLAKRNPALVENNPTKVHTTKV